jgi:Domain of unknown function DUF29
MSDYDTDFMRWTERQTDLLRRRAAGELPNDEGLDWLNLAEEIESVGASQKREVRSRLRLICLHLLKWIYQPERRETLTWQDTLYVQRRDLLDLLEDSLLLRPFAESALPKAFASGRQDAEHQLGRVLQVSDECPWPLEQILSLDFLPG